MTTEELLRKTYLQVLGRIELAEQAIETTIRALSQLDRNLQADREWLQELQQILLKEQECASTKESTDSSSMIPTD